VAETWSGYLNDIEGFHVTAETAMQALDAARAGPIEEGNVGGGTGMVCFGFKGGLGTSSRTVSIGGKSYTVGVLVQCNTGDRKVLRIAGAPVGQAFGKRWMPCFDAKVAKSAGPMKPCPDGTELPDQGSIIIVVATDAPLMPVQLNRVAKRAALGLGRLGPYAGNSSGDLILSFTTATAEVNHEDQERPSPITPLANQTIDPLFQATAEATEEAVVNALVAARTMDGVNGTRAFGLPHDELKAILKRYNRLEEPRKR
jgi:L-aminopeptidase/D-esterase-like protein